MSVTLNVVSDNPPFSERDLLIRIDTRVDSIRVDIDAMKSDFRALAKRVELLELVNARTGGFASGAKFFWGIITALPVGVVAYVLGGGHL